LIDPLFAEVRRLHDQPQAVKIALRMNEYNKSHMAVGKYAAWMSEVKSTANVTRALNLAL